MVVPHEHLQVAGAEALLNAGGCKSVAQNVGGNLLGDAGAVGDAADDHLDSPCAVIEFVVQGKIMRQDSEGSFGERHNAAFSFLAERPAFTEDQEPAILPEHVLFGQAGQLRYAKTGIEQSGDNDFLDPGSAGVGEAVGVFVR